jgi:protease-4
MIDSMHERFFNIVAAGRSIEAGTLRELADGRIFTADEALEHKLIDEIGYWDDVVVRTARLLGEPSVRIVRYERQPDFFEWLAEIRSPFAFDVWQEAGVPRFMYLWRP